MAEPRGKSKGKHHANDTARGQTSNLPTKERFQELDETNRQEFVQA